MISATYVSKYEAAGKESLAAGILTAEDYADAVAERKNRRFRSQRSR